MDSEIDHFGPDVIAVGGEVDAEHSFHHIGVLRLPVDSHDRVESKTSTAAPSCTRVSECGAGFDRLSEALDAALVGDWIRARRREP